MTKKLCTPEWERKVVRPRMLRHVRGAEDDGETYERANSVWAQGAMQRELDVDGDEEPVS